MKHSKPSFGEGWEDEVKAMERRGASLAEIARAFGVSTRTASRWRGRLSLRREEASPTRPPSDRERAASMLDDGCSFTEVARTLGVTGPTIRRWFPDRPAWTKSQAGTYAGMVRQLNKSHVSDAGRTAA